MNEKVKELINGIGTMTELWMIAYGGFKRQGMDEKETMYHTREFMTAFITSTLGMSSNRGGDSDD